jgi:hypothetical protein
LSNQHHDAIAEGCEMMAYFAEEHEIADKEKLRLNQCNISSK